jgi:hypothetical protein
MVFKVLNILFKGPVGGTLYDQKARAEPGFGAFYPAGFHFHLEGFNTRVGFGPDLHAMTVAGRKGRVGSAFHAVSAGIDVAKNRFALKPVDVHKGNAFVPGFPMHFFEIRRLGASFLRK